MCEMQFETNNVTNVNKQQQTNKHMAEVKALREAIDECERMADEVEVKCSLLIRMSTDENLGENERNRALAELENIRSVDTLPRIKAGMIQELNKLLNITPVEFD
eukprot:Pgem_evm1s12243